MKTTYDHQAFVDAVRGVLGLASLYSNPELKVEERFAVQSYDMPGERGVGMDGRVYRRVT